MKSDNNTKSPKNNGGELISTLFYMANHEIITAGEDMNTDFVHKCIDTAISLDKRLGTSEAEKQEFSEKILTAFRLKQEKLRQKRTRLSRALKAGLIAAVIAILGIIYCFGDIRPDTNMDALFVSNLKEYLSWDNGENRSVGNVENTVSTQSYFYTSFEDMLEEFPMDIIYPQTCPEGYELKEIVLSELSQAQRICVAYTNADNTVTYIIDSAGTIPSKTLEKSEYIEYNGIKFYPTTFDGKHQFSFYVDGYCYAVVGKNNNELKDIIKDLKKVEE